MPGKSDTKLKGQAKKVTNTRRREKRAANRISNLRDRASSKSARFRHERDAQFATRRMNPELKQKRHANDHRHVNVSCWVCGEKFPRNFDSQTIQGVRFVDPWRNVRNHWEEKHSTR